MATSSSRRNGTLTRRPCPTTQVTPGSLLSIPRVSLFVRVCGWVALWLLEFLELDFTVFLRLAVSLRHSLLCCHPSSICVVCTCVNHTASDSELGDLLSWPEFCSLVPEDKPLALVAKRCFCLRGKVSLALELIGM